LDLKVGLKYHYKISQYTQLNVITNLVSAKAAPKPKLPFN